MSNNNQFPAVAVNVIVIHEGTVLFGLRRSLPPAWTIPGGHMLFGESIEDCARREILEETGIEIDQVCIRAAINDVNHFDHTHYVNFFVTARYCNGFLRNGEPEDIFHWEWHSLNALPEPLFYNVKHFFSEISLAELLSCKCTFVCDASQRLHYKEPSGP